MTNCDLSHLCNFIIYMIDYRNLVASGWLRTCGFFCGSVWGRVWYRSREWSSGIYMVICHELESRTPHGNLEFVDSIVKFIVDENDTGREHGHQVYVSWYVIQQNRMKLSRTPHGNLEFVDCIVEYGTGRENGHQTHFTHCMYCVTNLAGMLLKIIMYTWFSFVEVVK